MLSSKVARSLQRPCPQVLFVCTANTLDTIPGPLLDRMEVIRLSGYAQGEYRTARLARTWQGFVIILIQVGRTTETGCPVTRLAIVLICIAYGAPRTALWEHSVGPVCSIACCASPLAAWHWRQDVLGWALPAAASPHVRLGTDIPHATDRLSALRADEKVAIARRYLEPQAAHDAGVPSGSVRLADDALEALISEYCREAGVRNLKKHIEKVRIGLLEAQCSIDCGTGTRASPGVLALCARRAACVLGCHAVNRRP